MHIFRALLWHRITSPNNILQQRPGGQLHLGQYRIQQRLQSHLLSIHLQ